MTLNYTLKGMTCGSCEASVTAALNKLEDIKEVVVSKEMQTATLTVKKPIPLSVLQNQLAAKYTIEEPAIIPETTEERTWLETYKPILLIFGFISMVTLLTQNNLPDFMRFFMAGFFLVFSFFKFLNLDGFAKSYAMYDIIAKKIPAWGYAYAVLELVLGIAFLVNFNPLSTNIIAFIIMSISIIGVLRSVLNKQKIQCACLGDVFNLPMSTVTIIEDGLMIIMSGFMIFHHLN